MTSGSDADLTPDERAEFDDLAARARALAPEDFRLDDPPPGLWDSIEVEISDDTARGGASRAARPWLVGLAAAAVLAVLAVGAWLLIGDDDGETILGRSELAGVEDPAATGQAELVQVDGEFRLRLVAENVDAPEGEYLEVWVADLEVPELISLGPVRPDGTYDLPAGIDPEAFPTVAISREPLDGDPNHAGHNVVAGQLEFT